MRLAHEAGRIVHDDGRSLRVGPGSMALPLAFARHPGRVLSRERPLELAPGREDEPFDRSIDQRIARPRKKLKAGPHHPVLIQSMHGRGHRDPG